MTPMMAKSAPTALRAPMSPPSATDWVQLFSNVSSMEYLENPEQRKAARNKRNKAAKFAKVGLREQVVARQQAGTPGRTLAGTQAARRPHVVLQVRAPRSIFL